MLNAREHLAYGEMEDDRREGSNNRSKSAENKEFVM
jgi:hypothetical protein